MNIHSWLRARRTNPPEAGALGVKKKKEEKKWCYNSYEIMKLDYVPEHSAS